MRIAHICTKFNRISETFIYDLVVGLERAGAENHVLTAARLHAAERPFARVRVLPIPAWRKGLFVLRKRWMGVYRFPWPLPAAARALREIRPDVLLAHFGGAGAAIAPVSAELGIPLVVTFHAFDLFLGHVRTGSYAGLWKAGARAVAVSEHGKRRLIELGCPPERVRVIHCGVDVEAFAAPGRLPRTGRGFRLVTLGRLVEKKGLDDLIRAVASVKRHRYYPVTLDIWGDGPLRRSLEWLSRRLGVQDIVRFRGVVAHEAVPRLLLDYDLFVLPSRTARNGDAEGIPITLLEAQAAGLPVVATRHAGIPEAVPPEHHDRLAKEGDPDDLARKLVLILSAPDTGQAMGVRGRQWVARHFALSGEIESYRALFREGAATRPAAGGA